MMFVVFAKQNLYYIDRFRMDATSADQSSVRGEFKFKTSHMGPKISLCYDNEKKKVFMSDQATGFIWSFSIKGTYIRCNFLSLVFLDKFSSSLSLFLPVPLFLFLCRL